MMTPTLFSAACAVCAYSLCAPALGASPAQLVAAAKQQIGVTVRYDPRYETLAYPNGDVPPERGVCTDVVIRAYRHLGVDLQRLVHEDMARAWDAYPTKAWQLKRPDRNIDHRRVLNLATWFGRHGQSLPVSKDVRDFKAGDVVTWMIPPRLPHIGIVGDRTGWTGAPLIIHNVGAGAVEEDVLFKWPMTGHFRYLPAPSP